MYSESLREAVEPERGSEATKPWEKERPGGPRDAAGTAG